MIFVVSGLNGLLYPPIQFFNERENFIMSQKTVNTNADSNVESTQKSFIILDDRKALRKWFSELDEAKNSEKQEGFRYSVACLESKDTKKILVLDDRFIDPDTVNILNDICKLRVNNMEASSKIVLINSIWIGTLPEDRIPLVCHSDGLKTYLLDFDTPEFKEFELFWNILDEQKPNAKSHLIEWDQIGKATRASKSKKEAKPIEVKALPEF